MRFAFDSNILVYAVDPKFGEPHHAAVGLLRRALGADCVLVLQTLGELFSVATGKCRLAPERVVGFIDKFREVFPVHAADLEAFDAAVEIVAAHRLSFWDAMIWAAARRAGCSVLFSEDMQDGRKLDGVTIVNPFNPANAALVDAVLPRAEPS